ncbi:MafI family immunity protein [Rhizobium croatiense]|uniref:MafI family immunity protein n=1 Tax=Rhizobium croatiense TaxID=2867516 RepID=UPI00289E79CC|nr:MafI family immunity protein [Rhizobium croatiense]
MISADACPRNISANTYHNECVVALEDLCTQLYEHDVVPAPGELITIRELAEEMNLEEDTWHFLRDSNS